jgi:lipopolysaccharide/colanic/teichoic acid biosynthesis glycosyltransferase
MVTLTERLKLHQAIILVRSFKVMLKRFLDIFVSFLGLLVLSPVFAIVAWKIRKNLGSPVLFKQVRPGKDGKPFEMVKFRTMRDAFDAEGYPLPDSERLTPFGNWIRSTSLDELPELWNALKGDMSLVGPRPLLMEYLPLYNPEQIRRHNVRPGVTGWAQVNGRNAISWEEKFNLDVWYVDNQSFWLDIKIVCLTVKRVLIRDGISAEGEVTMSKFTGTKS